MFCPSVSAFYHSVGEGGGWGSHLKAQEERVEVQQIGVFIRNETWVDKQNVRNEEDVPGSVHLFAFFLEGSQEQQIPEGRRSYRPDVMIQTHFKQPWAQKGRDRTRQKETTFF